MVFQLHLLLVESCFVVQLFDGWCEYSQCLYVLVPKSMYAFLCMRTVVLFIEYSCARIV